MSTLEHRRNGTLPTRAQLELITAKRAIALGKLTEFQRQCERLAKLVANDIVSLAAAADGLFEAAEANHLIEMYGADQIQRTFAQVFNTAPLDLARKGSTT